ncbi:uncharacterized protein LOC127784728 [Oryza glaberrima]|uniref:uncharacterized protein LOC127784728 n=1 Tax=Oryza glaberrima TaxID=4538 RepID=UPI00224C5437|nr:uncharacterized protein LOC127784728 [Oryza glaberrima]
MGNLPQQPAGEMYMIFTVDPNDRKYYLAAIDSSDEVIVKEKTETSRILDDIQASCVVSKPAAAAGDKQGTTKPDQIVPGAGSSSSRTHQPQTGERRRSTPETGSSKSAGKQPALREEGPLQVVLGTHDAEGERWITEGTPATADADDDRRLISRRCYIQRASNANLVFKAVNTGGRDGSIIELTDKPKVIMGSDQDQLFCCWTIVPVAGDHIIPDGGSSLSPSLTMDHSRLVIPVAQSGQFSSQCDTKPITPDKGASLSTDQPRLEATGETLKDGHKQGDNKKGKKK